MTIDLPHDVTHEIQEQMATGRFASEAEVLRSALRALRRQADELAAVQAGVADMDAGRHIPFEEVDTELRKRFGFKAGR